MYEEYSNALFVITPTSLFVISCVLSVIVTTIIAFVVTAGAKAKAAATEKQNENLRNAIKETYDLQADLGTTNEAISHLTKESGKSKAFVATILNLIPAMTTEARNLSLTPAGATRREHLDGPLVNFLRLDETSRNAIKSQRESNFQHAQVLEATNDAQAKHIEIQHAQIEKLLTEFARAAPKEVERVKREMMVVEKKEYQAAGSNVINLEAEKARHAGYQEGYAKGVADTDRRNDEQRAAAAKRKNDKSSSDKKPTTDDKASDEDSTSIAG